MRGLLAAVLAVSVGLSFAAPAFAETKAEALKKCEAVKDKAQKDACVAAANKMK